MRHTWINRTAPVLVITAVVGCAWYGISSRPKTVAILPGQAAHAAPVHGSSAAQANSAPIAGFAPTVSKSGTQVQFSLPDAKLANVQKVEFYIENTLVGAAFTAPYQVSVDEGNLTAGTHSVMAKVYTEDNTTQTTPALFTASPAAAYPATDDQTDTESTTTDTSSASSSSPLAVPTSLKATAGTDGVSALLSWTASADTSSYQIWRDGSQISSTAFTTFADTGLTAGQTYDYYIIAVSGSFQSNPSDQVGVSMPLSSAPPNSDDSSASLKGNSTGSKNQDTAEDLIQSKLPS